LNWFVSTCTIKILIISICQRFNTRNKSTLIKKTCYFYEDTFGSTIIVALSVLVIHVMNFAMLSQAQIQSLHKQTNSDIVKMSMRKLPSDIVGCGIMTSTPTAPLNGFSASVTFSYYQNKPYYPSDDFGHLLESACICHN